MKKVISTILGFEWVQNVALKKVARAAAGGVFVLAAKYTAFGAILAGFGMQPEAVTNGITVLGLMALEALRGWAKHSDKK
jgi:hypothetical protein